jgi:hypothetical protein
VLRAPTVTDELRNNVRFAPGWKVRKKLRSLTDAERGMVVAATVEHIRLCNWKVARGRRRVGLRSWGGARWLIRKPNRDGGLFKQQFKQQREPRCLPRPGLSWGYSPTRSSSIILLESAACEDNSEEAKTVPASAGQTEDTTQKQPHRNGAEVLQETTIQKLASAPGFQQRPPIGIGVGLAASPSHTTVHTGPYTAVR